MGTLVTITLYAESDEQAQSSFVSAFRRIAELNDILSDYKPESELSRICTLQRPLSRDLHTVIFEAQRLANDSRGAFDITVGPLVRLWRSARRAKRLPTDEEVGSAKHRSGYRKLQLQNGRAVCAVPGMQLDAGGIAKGYAADEALKVLREGGTPSAIVAISGDIALGDAPPGKGGWKVRLQGEDLVLSRQGISTSGDEFQSVEIGGARYSHIVDPRTGRPLKDSRSVSVIASSAMEADSLATAFSVMSPSEQGRLAQKRGVRVIVPNTL
jgi:thiamine biosynthesis lipoprotein